MEHLLHPRAQVLLQVPLGLLALALIGVVLARTVCWTNRAALAPVISQAGLLPALALIKGSDLYNGLRQLLFAAPAVAVLACLGVAWLCARPGMVRWRAAPVTAVVSLALLVPLVAQVRGFSCRLAFFTPVADAGGLAPDTDFWRTSIRELAPEVPTGRRIVCSPFVSRGVAQRYGFDGNEDCRIDEIGPLARYLPNAPADGVVPVEPEFTAVLERFDIVPDNCEPVAAVTRSLRRHELTMSQALRCRLPLAELPEGPIEFGAGVEGWDLLYRGWTTRRAEDGVQTIGDIAQIAFTARSSGAASLRLRLAHQNPCRIMVNGAEAMRLEGSSGMREVVVPLGSLDEGEVVDVALISGTARLGVQLASLEGRAE